MSVIQQLLIAYGGAAPSLWTTLNPSDKSADIGLSGGNLVATGNSAASGIVRAVHGKSTGKYYFEAVLTTAPSAGGVDTIAVGLANSTHGLTTSLGYANANGWALWGVGGSGYRHNGLVLSHTSSTEGDVYGFHVDLDADSLWVARNNTQLQGNPATGTSPLSNNLTGTMYPAACPWSLNRVITMRFDPASHSYSPAAGFTAGWPT